MRFRARWAILIGIVVMMCAPRPAAAQARHGVWFSGGAGVGSIRLAATDTTGTRLQPDRESGAALGFEIGWAVNPRVLVGLDMKVAAWNIQQGAVPRSAGHLGATMLYYRSGQTRQFFKGGIGSSFGEQGERLANQTRRGIAGSAGIGYDFYRGHGFLFTPSVNYWYGRIGGAQLQDGVSIRNWQHGVIDVTMALKFN